jgi:hypothetical protein
VKGGPKGKVTLTISLISHNTFGYHQKFQNFITLSLPNFFEIPYETPIIVTSFFGGGSHDYVQGACKFASKAWVEEENALGAFK